VNHGLGRVVRRSVSVSRVVIVSIVVVGKYVLGAAPGDDGKSWNIFPTGRPDVGLWPRADLIRADSHLMAVGREGGKSS